VWEQEAEATGTGAWVFYAIQLLLNWPWPAIFFGLKDLKLAFMDIALLFLACILNGIMFGIIDYVALLLFIPYWLWMSVLVPTTYFVWKHNAQA